MTRDNNDPGGVWSFELGNHFLFRTELKVMGIPQKVSCGGGLQNPETYKAGKHLKFLEQTTTIAQQLSDECLLNSQCSGTGSPQGLQTLETGDCPGLQKTPPPRP